ncbi:MAG: flagellar hook-basal body protein [Candidatus Latescibacteria bacterium]|nr:flagellar hook-basal body protein [Candidatus Latescibacterota bacterium]
MINGIYTSAAGMMPRTESQAVSTNNLANITTTGFKRDVSFRNALLDARLAVEDSQGSSDRATKIQQTAVDFSQGLLHRTERDLDVALLGDGFFAVETGQGIRYTRNGSFTMNANGELVTNVGHPVLGQGGKVVIAGGKVDINEKGDILVGGTFVDRIQVVDFAEERAGALWARSSGSTEKGRHYNQVLQKIGDGLYVTRDPDETGIPAGNVTIRQGFLEGSNVKAIEEMVELLTFNFRIFESNQKSIHAQDETLDKAVNDIGRFR